MGGSAGAMGTENADYDDQYHDDNNNFDHSKHDHNHNHDNDQ